MKKREEIRFWGKVKIVKIPLDTCTSLYGPFSVYNATTSDVYNDVEFSLSL